MCYQLISNRYLAKKMSNYKKTLKYLVPVFALCCFMLVIYGAYVPHKPAEVQRLVCIKFKTGTTDAEIQKHFKEFATMKNHVNDVVAYSAGHVQKTNDTNDEFDVVHYLTFRTKESAVEYVNNESRLDFIKENKANWTNVLEINSNIERK